MDEFELLEVNVEEEKKTHWTQETRTRMVKRQRGGTASVKETEKKKGQLENLMGIDWLCRGVKDLKVSHKRWNITILYDKSSITHSAMKVLTSQVNICRGSFQLIPGYLRIVITPSLLPPCAPSLYWPSPLPPSSTPLLLLVHFPTSLFFSPPSGEEDYE